MTTKHTPATPLPWTPEIHKRGKRTVGSLHQIRFHASDKDAAYIAHAANSYPLLVEALRVLQARIDACELGPVNTGREQADKIAEECAATRALLRELGEAE